MKKIYILLLIFSIFIIGTTNAQTPTLRSYEKAAKKALANQDFYSAWKYYEITLEIDSSRIHNMYNLGESARLFKSYEIAQKAYEKVLASEKKDEYPNAEFWLGDVKQRRQNYTGAVGHFQNFLSKQVTPKGPTDVTNINYSELAMKRIEACNWANERVKEPKKSYKIAPFGNGINTPATEFAPIEHQDEVYYSALGYDQENYCPDPNEDVSRLYTPNNASNGQTATINWMTSEDKSFIAHTAFNGDGSKMYFTRCKRVNASDFDCSIFYIKDKTAEGKWDESKAIRLPDNVNLVGTTSTQPNIGFDDNTGKELLFFVSDRSETGVGGRGDLNIMCSIIEPDGAVSAPVKLDFNTTEDDITPFFHKESNTLYFSSEGHRGYGGFDIYKTEKSGSSFGEVEAMEYPLNTSYDDVYFSTDSGMDNAYFSSNRKGVVYEAEGMETCCNDIFKLEYIKANLLPFTFNGLGEKQYSLDLDSCTVVLYDITGGGSGFEVDRGTNYEGNNYAFDLDLEREYMVIATREGRWTIDTTYVSTIGVTETTTFETNLNLFPAVDLISNTFNKKDNSSLTGCTFILKDVKTGEIILETNRLDDNRIYSLLEFGREYSIMATKEGFLPSEEIIFTTEGLTSGKTFNIPLYLEPIPILNVSVSLYFDNDEPDKRTRRTYTNRTYEDAYILYATSERIEEFVMENGKVLNGELKMQAQQETRDFFKKDVENGMIQLRLFAEYLEELLPKGGQYEIDIEGFASPRAPNDYNKFLTSRRVNSVENYLRRYKGGILAPYMGKGKGLELVLVPKGEEPSIGKGIPSRFSDPQSIFSIAASKERKVELVRFREVKVSTTR